MPSLIATPQPDVTPDLAPPPEDVVPVPAAPRAPPARDPLATPARPIPYQPGGTPPPTQPAQPPAKGSQPDKPADSSNIFY